MAHILLSLVDKYFKEESNLNKYKIKFSKIGRIKFIGHLDLLKVFQRSIVRAGLPIQYSQGFNPHQKTTFALPLSLGMESVGEYLEIELAQFMDAKVVCESLNRVMPKGITIDTVTHMKEKCSSVAAQVNAGLYEITFGNVNNLQSSINSMMNETEIVVTKKSKKGEKQANIRPDIYEMECVSDSTAKILIATGSQNNLNPRIVVKELLNQMEMDNTEVQCKRLDLLCKVNDNFVSLQEI